MADNEKEEGRPSQGADWEVVSLTASAYAAAPGPNDFSTTNESKEQGNIMPNESSAALFLSGHFVFPPSEHENLPIEPDLREVQGEKEEYNVSSEVIDSDKEDMHNSEFFDEGSRNSIHEVLVDSETDSVHSGVHKNSSIIDTSEHSDANMGSPKDHTKRDEVESDGSNLPCEAWWKRHVITVYRHAKEANGFWSFVVAAAVMGIVVLGRRWQQDKRQFHQMSWRASSSDEKTSRLLGSIGRFKDVLIRGHQRGSLLGAGASAGF